MSKNKCKIICITGGKGGTGKTLCAVNLAIMFKNEGKKVLLIDGDVENPNTYLLLNGMLNNKQDVPFFKPKIVEDKCSKCGLCAQNCLANALLHVKDAFPIPILTVCSGCKLCYKICPENAIEEDSKTIGWTYSTKINNLSLILGELKPSEARSATIVEALLEKLERILENKSDNFDIIILDTAPGAHCDVELLIAYADKVIPITEPTKFGKLDLIRIMELIKLLGKESRVIVNRSSLLGFREQFLNELAKENIEVLGDIPLDSDIIESYCQGTPIMDNNGKFNKNGAGYVAFIKIYEKLKKWIELIN
ncbi:MAG: AAA family ATPase [Candidatus Heimdallarchaeota archaeon]